MKLNLGSALLVAMIAAPAAARTIAVLGDSLSTGAAAHPALAFDGNVLWSVFSGQTPVGPRRSDLPTVTELPLPETLSAPVRLWPTSREFFGGPDWLYRHSLQTLSRAYLDTEEYSWGYLTSLGVGVAAADVWIAGEDGARVDSMPRHLDRVLDRGQGELPDDVMILYTGNDLCGLALTQVTPAERFETALDQGFDYLLTNGRARSAGTTVHLLSYLSILQLLHDPDILDKEVRAFGTRTTCRDLRANGYGPKNATEVVASAAGPWYFHAYMPPNPSAFCPTLFGQVGGNPDETIGVLANRVRDFRAAEARAVERANAKAKTLGKAVRFRHVTATAELIFKGPDIAEDCFHLSAAGQVKVAIATLPSLRASAAK